MSLQVAHLPLCILETTLLTLLVYFMAGFSLVSGASNFFWFYVLFLSLAIYGQAFGRVLAFAVPDLHVGEGVAPGKCCGPNILL